MIFRVIEFLTSAAFREKTNYAFPQMGKFWPGGGGIHDLRSDGVYHPVVRKLPSSNYRQLPSFPLL